MSARIQMRVEEAAKVRWNAAAKRLGFPDLTAFITHAANEASLEEGQGIGQETTSADGLDSVVSKNVSAGVPVPSSSDESLDTVPPSPDESHGTRAGAAGNQLRAGAVSSLTASACPRENHHRKGLWCKGCGRFIK